MTDKDADMQHIDLIETQEQRDADRIREHAPALLAALQAMTAASEQRHAAVVRTHKDAIEAEIVQWLAEDQALEAIEYATGAHDPASYPEDGYGVDASGTFKG